MSKRLSYFIMAALCWLTWGAWASEVHHSSQGIPWRSIVVQLVNLLGLVIFLGFMLRKTMAHYFAQRRSVYLDLIQKAVRAQTEAETHRQAIADRILRLEQETQKNLNSARAEGEELRNRFLQEAQNVAVKLKKDMQMSLQVERQKNLRFLKEEALSQAIEEAEKNLKNKMGSSEQKQLQIEFVEKILVQEYASH